MGYKVKVYEIDKFTELRNLADDEVLNVVKEVLKKEDARIYIEAI